MFKMTSIQLNAFFKAHDNVVSVVFTNQPRNSSDLFLNGLVTILLVLEVPSRHLIVCQFIYLLKGN